MPFICILIVDFFSNFLHPNRQPEYSTSTFSGVIASRSLAMAKHPVRKQSPVEQKISGFLRLVHSQVILASGRTISFQKIAKVLLVGLVVLLSIYSGYQGFEKNYSSTIYYNNVYDEYKIVKSMILEDNPKRGPNTGDIAILARDTWDVYEGTGFKSVMVPNNDINTIIFVAQRYNAHYLLLPALRPQLDKIYTGSGPDWPRAIFRYENLLH